MNRRAMLAKLCGFGAVVAAEGAVLDTIHRDAGEDAPILFAISHPGKLSPEAIANIRAEWQQLWKGKPPAPVVILQEGMQLAPIRRRQTVEHLRAALARCADAIPAGDVDTEGSEAQAAYREAMRLLRIVEV